MEIAQERPPYVRYEYRAIEDRNATIEAGHFVARDVAYALITQPGSRDTVELVVEDWFSSLAADADNGRFPRDWLDAFKKQFAAWRDDRELPVDGTPIQNWPILSPAQVRTLQDLRVRSVEDLAAANAELIGRLGMGGLSLVQKAKDWLKNASSSGKIVEELASLKAANAELSAANAKLVEQNAELLARLPKKL